MFNDVTRSHRRRAVITGIGVMCGPVAGVDQFWDALTDPTPRPTFTRMENFNPRDWLDRREVRHSVRFAQFGFAAATLATQDSGLKPDQYAPERTSVVMGTGGGGGGASAIHELDNYRKYGPVGVSPLIGVRTMSNAGTALIALNMKCTGETQSIASGCASGTHAMGHAMRLIQYGGAEMVYAGGAEVFYAPEDDERSTELCDAMLAGLANLRVLTTDATSRPFDKDRDGFVAADGAAVMIVEEYEAARARGAQIYCEIVGYGNTNDATDLISPRTDGEGLRQAMSIAVADADGVGTDVRLVNVHGTATHTNDVAECLATANLCGTDPGPAIHSIKGLVGHSGAGAGAMESAAVALSISRGKIPHTAGLRELDPDIVALGVDVVAGQPRDWTPGLSLSTSVSLGGHNGCIAMAPVTD